jgi:hypothetical protein
VDPLTVGAGVIFLGLGMPGRDDSKAGNVIANAADIAALAARARFPMGKWQGYKPTRSQEYRAPDHHGCDVMYRRAGGSGAPDLAFPPGGTDGSKNHFCPPGQKIYAIADGILWNSGRGGTGLYVTIDHGAPWASFYVHLESLTIPSGISRGAGRIQIRAGQELGTVGYSPRDAAKLRHLHFELWYKGGSTNHVDPWPVIGNAPLVG